ncbi:MAG: exo-beta-N-acetylmuramidase NamZ domain-containing protein, partial [Bacteroidota bacterium]
MIRFEYKKLTVLLALLLVVYSQNITAQVITGAEQLPKYLPMLKGKKVGMVVNQTSQINGVHLVDTLKKLKVNITSIFAPEHGFRGDHSAGAKVKSNIDVKTGLPVISLYGKQYKPTPEVMKTLDIVVFDIQDVGARFYTYISTLHYVMEACAEHKKTLIVLDRPNPNGFYVDGPVLDLKFKSFVGMHPVPVVHGLTVGEYAQMINGEQWLKDSIQCKL